MLTVCVGVGEEFRNDFGWGRRILREERGGGEQSEEHNNCSCVCMRGSSNMRALGHRKGL